MENRKKCVVSSAQLGNVIHVDFSTVRICVVIVFVFYFKFFFLGIEIKNNFLKIENKNYYQSYPNSRKINMDNTD